MAAAAALAAHPEPWHLAARLASAIARPVDHALATAYPDSPLTAAPLAALVRHPAFHHPLNRALSRRLRLGETEITPDVLARIASSRDTRLCVLLVSEPIALVREAAAALGAALLHREVVRVVMKADRDRVRAVLGEVGFQVATQEAVLLHAPLAALCPAGAGAAVLDPGLEVKAARGALSGLGLDALAGFADLVEPAMAPLVRRRIAGAPGPALPRTGLPTPEQGEHIVRLLRRRIGAWSALIG